MAAAQGAGARRVLGRPGAQGRRGGGAEAEAGGGCGQDLLRYRLEQWKGSSSRREAGTERLTMRWLSIMEGVEGGAGREGKQQGPSVFERKSDECVIY